MKIILLLFTILVGGYSHGSELRKLYVQDSFFSGVIVTYSPTERKIFLKYRGNRFSSEEKLEYQVEGPEEVDLAISSIKSLLSTRKYEEKTIEDIVSSIENIKYLEGSICNVISFSSVTPDSANSLGPLVKKITKELSKQDKDFQKFLVTDINIKDGDKVELYALTDNKFEINHFSLVSRKGDISNLKIVKDGDYHHVLDGESHLLTLHASKINKNIVSIIKKRSKGLQNTESSSFRVQKIGNILSATPVFSSKESRVTSIKELQLLNDSILHERVIRVDNSDRFFKSISPRELRYIKYYDYSLIGDTIENYFVRCMSEYLVSREGSNLSLALDKARSSCIQSAELEGIVNKSVEVNMSLSKEDEYSAKGLEKRIVSCLKRYEVFIDVQKIRIFQSPIKASDDEIDGCLALLSKDVVKSEFNRTLEKDFELQSFFAGESLFSDLKKKLSKEIDDCFLRTDEQACLDRVKKGRDLVAFELFLSDRAGKRNVSDKSMEGVLGELRLCFDLSKDACIKKAFFAVEGFNEGFDLHNLSESIVPGLHVQFKPEDKDTFLRLYSRCYKQGVIDEDELFSLISSLAEKSYECQLVAYKSVAPSGLSSALLLKSPFNDSTEEEKESLKKAIENELYSQLNAEDNISDIRDTLLDFEGDALIFYLDSYIKKRLSEVNSEDGNLKRVERMILSSINGDSKVSLKENIKSHIRKQRVKKNRFDIHHFSNTLLKSFELELSKESSLKDCIKEYSPRSKKINIKDHLQKCQKLSEIEKFFLTSKSELENLVSMNFELSSNEANNILAPIYYLEECLKDEWSNLEVDLERKLRGCYDLTKFDVSRNILEIDIQRNRAVLSDQGKSASSISKICHENMFLILANKVKKSDEISFDLKDSYLDSLNKSIEGVDLIELFQLGHSRPGSGSILQNQMSGTVLQKKALRDLVLILGDRRIVDEGWLSSYSKGCSESIDKILFNSFRGFILENIPASTMLTSKFRAKENRVLLTAIFDNELLAQILALSSKSTVPAVTSPSGELQSLIVSSELGTESLARLVAVLGQYLSEGLIFDQSGMETELVVFRSELKRALKWMNKQNRPVSLSDLKDFFQSTELADVMAYAVVSKNVVELFKDHFEREEREEELVLLRKFNKRRPESLDSDQRLQWDRMKKKFSNLKSLSQRMALSYDFKRLFRAGSEETRKNLDMIKKDFLLPLIVSGSTSHEAEKRVLKIVSDLIVKDDADGGFAERFAAAAAEELLTNEQGSKWAITKYLFYDKNDFDWNTLRNTSSGEKAIHYYTKYILLPEIVDQKLAQHTRSTRLNHFKLLLDKAQSENDE